MGKHRKARDVDQLVRFWLIFTVVRKQRPERRLKPLFLCRKRGFKVRIYVENDAYSMKINDLPWSDPSAFFEEGGADGFGGGGAADEAG